MAWAVAGREFTSRIQSNAASRSLQVLISRLARGARNFCERDQSGSQDDGNMAGKKQGYRAAALETEFELKGDEERKALSIGQGAS